MMEEIGQRLLNATAKRMESLAGTRKMDSIFIWLPLVYTTNDQLNLTFAKC
jgi:hypothetical protein